MAYDYYVSIDPSINYCGICIWKSNNDRFKIIGKGLIKPDPKCDNEYAKADSVKEQIYNIVNKCCDKGTTYMVLEVPAHWVIGGFEARESGNLGKLQFVCGMLYGILGASHTYWVFPATWKGQYPKHVVRNRLRDIHFKDNENLKQYINKCNHNVMDAIGIGYWYLYKKKLGKTV